MSISKLLSRALPGFLFSAGFAALLTLAADTPKQTVWTFDHLSNIGGNPTHVEGHPKLIDTSAGKAVEFNGVDDALFIDKHPMAGFKTFTFEAIFRPDGGAVEQRWFHLASIDPQTGQDSLPSSTNDRNPRFTLELRVVDQDKWYLDTYTRGDGYSRALAFPEKLHPIGRWYTVAQTYDGKMYRSYVDGVMQGEADIDFKPQGPGRASVGVRINRVNYFKGAVLKARFTPRALTPDKFLKVPAGLQQ